MKVVLGALFSVAALAAACAPATADISPTPSASASMPTEVWPDDVVVFGRTDIKGMIGVGSRVAFDLPDAASWTATVDTAGIIDLNLGELTGTAVAPGNVLITLTNGSETIVYEIRVKSVGVACDGQGELPEETANEVLLAVRTFLAAYDTAIASGDNTTLAALFETSTAAKPWTDSAKRLHLAGAKRTYPFIDPHTTCGVFEIKGAGQVFWSSGGPMYVVDEAADGSELDRVIWKALFCTVVEINGTWRIREAEFVD
jgi:hypothetical protein